MDGYKQGQRLILKVRRVFSFLLFVYNFLTRQLFVYFLEGEEITLHYSGGLKGRLQRRKMLAEGWFFSCLCQRFEFIYF